MNDKFKNFAVLTLAISGVTKKENREGKPYTIAAGSLPMGEGKAAMPIKIVVTNGLTKVLKDGENLTLVGRLAYEEKDGQGKVVFFPWKFEESERPRNYVKLSLRAGTDGESRYSDTGNYWARVRMALSQGKNEDGSYKPSLWFTVKGFTSKDGDDTVPNEIAAVAKGELHTVSGRLAYEVNAETGRVYVNLMAVKVETFTFETEGEGEAPEDDGEMSY